MLGIHYTQYQNKHFRLIIRNALKFNKIIMKSIWLSSMRTAGSAHIAIIIFNIFVDLRRNSALWCFFVFFFFISALNASAVGWFFVFAIKIRWKMNEIWIKQMCFVLTRGSIYLWLRYFCYINTIEVLDRELGGMCVLVFDIFEFWNSTITTFVLEGSSHAVCAVTFVTQ